MSESTHYYGDGHDHVAAGEPWLDEVSQEQAKEIDERQAAADARDAKRDTLAIPLHYFVVTLGVGRWGGLEYDLTCPGDENALCHWWQDAEDDPRSFAHHDECAILDWFRNDTADFVESGYSGPARHSLVSGPVEITTWGEDGIEWRYPADVDGQLERARVSRAIAYWFNDRDPLLNDQIDALTDEIMAALAGEDE